MKPFIFKIVIVIGLVIYPSIVYCQDKDNYQQRIENYRSSWEKLIPTYHKIQFAGDMGLLSFGFGWDYGKKKQLETDFFIGFTPKYSTEDFKFTITLKQNYFPWNIAINEKFHFNPLACGIYLNTILNGDFWVREPKRYPNGYYGFSSKIRTHIFLGQRFTYEIANKQIYPAKSLSLFYELSTCDVYLVSAIGNRYLKPHDYLVLSFGLKIQLL